MKARMRVSGMSCGHCAARVRSALLSVPGTRRAEVDLSSGTAEVEGDALRDGDLIAAVAESGYAAEKLPGPID